MIRWIALSVAALAAQPAVGQEAPARPALISELVKCRSIADIAGRVACYDRQVSALDEAERKRDVVLVDRAEVRKARRSLFGLPIPKIGIFENDDKDEPEFTRIDATVTAAQRTGGKWLFELNDGSRWLQSDAEELARAPKPGNRIRVRKGALGSYLANVETAPAIRVRRIE